MARARADSLQRALRKRFSTFVSRRKDRPAALSEVIRVVRQGGLTVFAFGGAPRGVLHEGGFYRPRDLDLVFDDEHFRVFQSAFESCILRRNSYGGLRLRITDMAVDAWPLGATWAFRTGVCSPPSFETLPRTTFLNVDGLVVELSPQRGKSRRVFEAGFFSAWQQKLLDINLRDNPHPSVCVARTLCISRRFGFRLSPALARYLWEMLTALPAEELLRSQVLHYGRIEFPADSLDAVRHHLERYLDLSTSSPFALFQMELPFPPAAAEPLPLDRPADDVLGAGWVR